VGEGGLDGLAVVQPAADAAAVRGADHQRAGPRAVAAVAHQPGLADDLVHGREDEVSKLDLADRPQSMQRHADAHGDDRRLRQRRVDHPVRAELGEQSLGGAEDAAARPHVLAGEDDARVAAHLLGQGVTDGLEDVLGGHG
jgi:hypothetical protein